MTTHYLKKNQVNHSQSLGFIFSVVLIEFTSLGIIIPLSPYLARDFGADDLQVGLLMSVYSLAQIMFAPLWGYLSDLFGRKPVILISLAGGALFYLWFAFANSLQVLFLTRVLSGMFSAVMPLSLASVADHTQQNMRSKNMGLIGSAIGLGFVIGPLLGGVLGKIGRELGSHPPFGSSFCVLGAFLLCVLNGLLVFFFLKESFFTSHNSADKKKIIILSSVLSRHRDRIKELIVACRHSILKRVLWMYFLLMLSLAGVEMSLFLYVKDQFAWSHFPSSLGFAIIGCLIAFTQGFLVRKWIPKFGERKTLIIGFWVMGLGLLGIGHSIWLGILALGVTGLCIGYGLANTCLSGAISLLTNKDRQGGVFGVQSSLFAMARILGPILGGWFYRDISHSSSFYLSCFWVMIAGVVCWSLKNQFPEKGKTHLLVRKTC